MKLGKNNLSKQLLFVVGIAFLLLFISLGAILPRMLIPVAESNIYSYLSEPLKIYDNNYNQKLKMDNRDMYLYVDIVSYYYKNPLNFDNLLFFEYT